MDGKTVFCVIMTVAAFLMILMYRRCKRPFLTFFNTALLGLALNFVLFYTGPITGIGMPLNIYTASCSALLSVPGVVMILLLDFV